MDDLQNKCLDNPKLRAMLDPATLASLIRQRRLDRNHAFMIELNPDLRNDYLSYLRLNVGEPADIELWRAELVARYLATANLGRWADKAWNARCRDRGGSPKGPPRREYFYDEDVIAMMNHAILHEPKPTPAAEFEANTRFAEATRQASFSLQLGIREIRLLAQRPWDGQRWLQAEYTAALQRLIEKGLLIHEVGQPPRLSAAGEHARAMLVISRHIVD